MKKIKYLIIIIMILLFTGCKGDYNLNFNKDLSINEELIVFINNTEDNYNRTYYLLEKSGIDEDDYEVTVVSDEIKIEYRKKYSSFEEYYLYSKLYKMLFKNINYTKDNIGSTIFAESNLKLDGKNNQKIVNTYDIENFNINLKVPFIVNDNNADKVSDDIYTWVLNNDDTYKNIDIKYSYKSGDTGSTVVLIVIGIISLALLIYILNTIVKNRRV